MSKRTRPSNSRDHKIRNRRIMKRLTRLKARVWGLCNNVPEIDKDLSTGLAKLAKVISS